MSSSVVWTTQAYWSVTEALAKGCHRSIGTDTKTLYCDRPLFQMDWYQATPLYHCWNCHRPPERHLWHPWHARTGSVLQWASICISGIQEIRCQLGVWKYHLTSTLLPGQQSWRKCSKNCWGHIGPRRARYCPTELLQYRAPLHWCQPSQSLMDRHLQTCLSTISKLLIPKQPDHALICHSDQVTKA